MLHHVLHQGGSDALTLRRRWYDGVEEIERPRLALCVLEVSFTSIDRYLETMRCGVVRDGHDECSVNRTWEVSWSE